MKSIAWKTVFSFVGTVFIPGMYLVNMLIIFAHAHTFRVPISVVILGIILASIGTYLWIAAMITLKKSFGVLPQKQKRIKTGLYKYYNHPMYVGIYAAFLGLSLANESWQGLFFLTVFLLPILVIRATFEDKYLT